MFQRQVVRQTIPNRLLLSQSVLAQGNVKIAKGKQALVYQAVGRLSLESEIILRDETFPHATIICKTVTLLSTENEAEVSQFDPSL